MWSVVAALSYPDRVIGVSRRLPWHLPMELRLFRELTWGGVVVMGRQTWESIGRDLPGRETWILSRTLLPSDQRRVFSHVEELKASLSKVQRPVFFIGGAAIFQIALSMPEVTRLYLTWVDLSVRGDVFFPPFSEEEWEVAQWEFFSEKCISYVRAVYLRIKGG
ncbi:MAG: dihydrofolate reductase [Bacteroidia bacterium]|nr:dihydrofolate reductase [Bacteroidia bacterium]